MEQEQKKEEEEEKEEEERRRWKWSRRWKRQGSLFSLAENDIRVSHIHVIEILVIDRLCN